MSRTLIITFVALASYGLFELATSGLIGMLWRTRGAAQPALPPRIRARRVFLLRLVPSALAAAIAAIVVTAFAMFEPPSYGEEVGPLLVVLACFAALQLTAGCIRAVRSAWHTYRVEQAWLRGAAKIATPSLGEFETFVVSSPTPILALVGLFAPKLIAARSVIDACSPEEIAQVVAHERGHLKARDNLKQWIMTSLPDTLTWTAVHREIVEAWHVAAEDAADDAATGGDASVRADLAALLLKVVKLTPGPAWDAAVVSPFVEEHELERRVKRLLKPELEPPARLALVPLSVTLIVAGAMVATLSSPAALQAIFRTFEQLVAFGR